MPIEFAATHGAQRFRKSLPVRTNVSILSLEFIPVADPGCVIPVRNFLCSSLQLQWRSLGALVRVIE